jgi:hypothetical protein
MPPQYKTYEPAPLSPYTMGLLQEVSSTHPGDFNAKYNDALKTKQAIESQQLNQQSVQMSLAEKQRQAAQEKAQADALAIELGKMDTNAPIDMNKVWEVVQRNAVKHNDIKTATDIERATRESAYGSNQLLDPGVALNLGLPPETTVAEARLAIKERERLDRNDRFGDEDVVRNRQLTVKLKAQQAAGEQIRPATPAQAAKVGAANAFMRVVDETNAKYIPYLSDNRAARWFDQVVNPNSAEARYANKLVLIAKTAALALEDRVTDKDSQIIENLTTPDARDTLATVIDKVQELRRYIELRLAEDLDAMKRGGFNTRGLENKYPAKDPNALAEELAGQPSPSGTPVPTGRTPEQEARYQKVKADRLAQLEAGGQ